MRSLVAATLLVAISGCGHSIGDACRSNVDCSPQGDRFCDTASTGGYCTVEGCDVGTCPNNEACVRFLTPLHNEPCMFDPGTLTSSGCRPDERCVPDSVPQSVAATNGCPQAPMGGAIAGHCAPESSERRWCQHRCNNDGDCRIGYQCVTTSPAPVFADPKHPLPSLPGALPVSTLADPFGLCQTASFCAQPG